VVFVPQNLAVKVPRAVSDEAAAYVTLGAIALHGLRQAEQQVGATVMVVGLGLVGQLAVALCKTSGLRVLGLDLDERKVKQSLETGASAASTSKSPDLPACVAEISRGRGMDAVLITAASPKDGHILDWVAGFCRDRARIVVVGDVKLEMSRRLFFEKELEVIQSRSYGPGRYDPHYEEAGNDYPVGYVRWTERRNMEAFMDLVSEGRIEPERLTTHRFPIESAEAAYEVVTKGSSELAIGVVLEYPKSSEATDPSPRPATSPVRAADSIRLGVIGTGQFARGILLPALRATGAFQFRGIASNRGLSSEWVRKRYDAEYATTDANRVLDDDAVDAVVIATRHDSHARYAIRALRQGKHVFVEKPLCLTHDELEEVAQAATEASTTLTVGFNRRFSPLSVKIRDFFAGRSEPLAMNYRINSGRIALTDEGAWVHDPEFGGGRIVGEVCHFVDTLQSLCGSSPVRVSCFGVNPGRHTLASDDIVTLVLEYSDGSQGTIQYWSNGDRRLPKERFEVFCEEKIAVCEDFRRLELVSRGRRRRIRLLGQQKGFREEAQAFRDACASGVAPIPIGTLVETARVTLLAVEDLLAPAPNEDKPTGG
jgi:polar amino acid transport system substrate-binding protein